MVHTQPETNRPDERLVQASNKMATCFILWDFLHPRTNAKLNQYYIFTISVNYNKMPCQTK